MSKPHFAIGKRKARSDQRRALQQALAKAIRDKDLDAAEQLQEELDALAPKSNGRSSSSVCRDPFDPELLELYKDKAVHEILAEFGKEIRVDFGFLGMVAGLVGIIDAGCEAVGENISPSLRKELVRRLARKFVERTHGMGMLYTERANQIIRKLYEHTEVVKALGLPTGERPWIRRKTLAESVDFDSDFARRWAAFEAGQVDVEATNAATDTAQQQQTRAATTPDGATAAEATRIGQAERDGDSTDPHEVMSAGKSAASRSEQRTGTPVQEQRNGAVPGDAATVARTEGATSTNDDVAPTNKLDLNSLLD